MYISPKKRAKFVDCILVKSLICYTPSVHFQDGWILNLLSCKFMLRKWKQRKKERNQVSQAIHFAIVLKTRIKDI